MTDSTDNDRRNMFKEAVRNVESCAELVIKQLEGEERNAQLKELKTVMQEYCDLDNNWRLEKRTISEIEKSLTEECNINNIDEMYANLRKKQIETDPRKHEWYLNLEKKIKEWMRTDDPDCDIMSTEMTHSLLDPFTKLQMKDPVKNTCCGHSYERVTILAILQSKKEMRCPVVGCRYQGYFNENHLEDDREMLRQLKHLEVN
uniref:E3 SUMO-protein ligase NSE2 n=1 Tax=Graphocephala atropunctata TaxID=36148 RepID=A0A1B6LL20_9HEMI